MSKKVNHLKDELRRTFTIYALIPTFLVASFILVVALVYWNINVLEQNRSRLSVACQFIDTLVVSYMERADDIAALCNITQLKGDQNARTEMYGRLYQYTHTVGGKTEFYLYDDKLNRIISNQNQDPEFVGLARTVDWGIIGQIKRKPAKSVFAFVSPIQDYGSQMDMVIGKAILESGQITGYVLFVVPEAQFLSMMSNSYVDFVVKDRYDYTPLCTDNFFQDELNKMKPEFISAAGYVPFGDRKYYISKEDILHGEFTVYALTSIGDIVNQLTNTLLILIGVLVILSISIIVSVKKQVEEKTKMIDQLVDAFSAAQNGNLDMRLAINTNNEFQIISEAYNSMLFSLKELMKINHEKGRASVISEIKQLESQFNPHFLFNTLENIKFMIKLDPAAANKMIVALSNILRYSIDNSSSEVTIRQDMEYTQSYLEIQRYRFGKRLNYFIDIPPTVENGIVPKLIIQPIIENAIKYGFRDCTQILVGIEMYIIGHGLIIKITNNGSEIEEQLLKKIRVALASDINCSQHSGLYNVNRRIQLMYGEAYGVDISSSRTDGTTVTISLPFRQQV